jgi:hypothetical protein
MLKETSKLVLVSVVTVFLGVPSLGADAAAPPLKRPVSVSAENESLSDYVLAAFTSAGISGGIAIVNDRCVDASEQFPEFKGSAQDALEKLASTGHQLRWFQAGESLVVHNTPSAPPLLKVVVREFHFSRKEALTKASSDLFDAAEARDQVRANDADAVASVSGKEWAQGRLFPQVNYRTDWRVRDASCGKPF